MTAPKIPDAAVLASLHEYFRRFYGPNYDRAAVPVVGSKMFEDHRAGLAAALPLLTAQLQQERDEYRDDYIRVHHEKMDIYEQDMQLKQERRRLLDENAALLDVALAARDMSDADEVALLEDTDKARAEAAAATQRFDEAIDHPLVVARLKESGVTTQTDEPKRGKCRIAGGEPGAER